jgi:hypothetical protein
VFSIIVRIIYILSNLKVGSCILYLHERDRCSLRTDLRASLLLVQLRIRDSFTLFRLYLCFHNFYWRRFCLSTVRLPNVEERTTENFDEYLHTCSLIYTYISKKVNSSISNITLNLHLLSIFEDETRETVRKVVIIQWLRFTFFSKGPNRVCISFPSAEDWNGRWTKSINPDILSEYYIFLLSFLLFSFVSK